MNTLFLLIGTISIVLMVAIIFILANQKRTLASDMARYLEKVAYEALQASTKNTIEVASRELAGDREKLKQHLDIMREEMTKHQQNLFAAEKDRKESYGAIWNALTQHREQTAELKMTADQISKLLSNNQMRGAWGEQAAEQILQSAGLIENTHYKKQDTLKNGSRPDFTFLLPKGKKIAMDVKFPFAALQKFQDTDVNQEKEEHTKQFGTDLKTKITEVKSRGYTSTENDCLGLAILFVPSEMIFSFIQQKYPAIVADAMKSKIILASPFTLLSLVFLIQREYQFFYQSQNIQKIFQVIEEFAKDYTRFEEELKLLENNFSKVHDGLNQITTTRSNKLNLRFRQIKELQSGADNPSMNLE